MRDQNPEASRRVDREAELEKTRGDVAELRDRVQGVRRRLDESAGALEDAERRAVDAETRARELDEQIKTQAETHRLQLEDAVPEGRGPRAAGGLPLPEGRRPRAGDGLPLPEGRGPRARGGLPLPDGRGPRAVGGLPEGSVQSEAGTPDTDSRQDVDLESKDTGADHEPRQLVNKWASRLRRRKQLVAKDG